MNYLKLAERHQIIWLYELLENEFKNKDIQYNLHTLHSHAIFEIKVCPFLEKRIPDLENIYIFQSETDSLTFDKFWIEQHHSVAQLYGGDRRYYTEEYKRSEHRNFLWNFRINKSVSYNLNPNPAGKAVQSNNTKILGFLFYIFCIKEPFDVHLLVKFLEKLRSEDIDLWNEKVPEFFQVLQYSQEKRPLEKDEKNLSWVLALGVLPKKNIRSETITALKAMKIDFLTQENEREILNLQFDESLQEYFLMGLSALFSLKQQLDGEESITFFNKLKEYDDYQMQVINILKNSNFKFSRLSVDILIVNRFFADKSSDKISLLIFLLESFKDPLEVMSIIIHFMDLFFPKRNDETRYSLVAENQSQNQEEFKQAQNDKKDLEPREQSLPGFNYSEETKLEHNPDEENMISPSDQNDELALSKKDEEDLVKYLSKKIMFSTVPKHDISKSVDIYSSLVLKVPESIQKIFFRCIISSKTEIEQTVHIYTTSQRLCLNSPELTYYCSTNIKEILSNYNYTLENICKALPTLSKLSRSLINQIFDHSFKQNFKSKLNHRLTNSYQFDYLDCIRTLLLSDLIYPVGCIDIVQDLLKISSTTKDVKEFLIVEIFVPHESKISEEEFEKELKSVIKFFVDTHGVAVDINWKNKIIGQIIQRLNPKTNFPMLAVREYLKNYHSKYFVKEVLKLPNYSFLFDLEVFFKEYLIYVEDRVLFEFEIKGQKEQAAKNKKDGQRSAKSEKENIESRMKQYIELLKPSDSDAKRVFDLKTKLLISLLNLVDPDQINKSLQSVLYEDPRTDHLWYIILEIASIPDFHYKEIKALNTIVEFLDKVLQNLVEKNLDIQTVGKLAKITEKKERKQIFISYLDQAQQIKNVDKIINTQKALENIIAAHQDCLKEYKLFDPYLKSVALKASDGQALVVAYNKLKEGLDKIKVKEFAFSEELQKVYPIFKIFSDYSASSCFKTYYDDAVSQLNKKPEQISVEEYNAAIMRAKDRFLELKDKLPKFSQLKLAELQNLFRGIVDPTLEIIDLKKLELIPDENVAENLKTLLKQFHGREKTRELCQLLLLLFKIFEVPQGELSSHAQEYLKMLEGQENVIAENFSCLSNKMKIINDLLKNDVLYTMIEEFAGAEELIRFIKSTHQEDIKAMLDGLDEYGESLVQAQSIVELNIVKQYISKLDKSSEVKLLESMKGLIQTQKKMFNGIEKYIASCKNEISAIKNLYSQLTSREEANKTKIMEIVKKSWIWIKSLSNLNPSSDQYVITFHYKGGKILSLSEAADLRDRGLLIVNKEKSVEALIDNYAQESMNSIHSEDGQKTEHIVEKQQSTEDYFKIFVEIIDMIISIDLNLGKLYETGYPEKFEQEIFIKGGKHRHLQEIHFGINDKLNAWEQNLKQCVKNYSVLSNFCGQQYWILERLFAPDCNEKEKARGLNILRYINSKISLKEVLSFVDEAQEAQKLSQKDPKDRLQRLGSKLSELFDQIGEAPKQEIPMKYEHRYNFGQGKILLTKCPDKFNIVERVLAIYAKPSDGAHYPISNQILFCSGQTTWENIRSFLFLIFADTTGTIYTLANADKLQFSLKSQLTQTFKELYDEEKKPRFRLAIICTESDSQLYTHFMQYSIAFVLKDNVNLSVDEIKELLKKWDINATTITSHRNGLGKTHLIKSLAAQTGQSLVSFIVTGNVNLASYAQRLFSNPTLRSDKTKIALHLDIGTVDDYAEVNELLFMLICLRAFKVQNDAFICGQNVTIYVEIANTWSDKLKISLPFCNYLNQKFIEKLDLNNIDPGKSLNNPIQHACNYLLLLEETADKKKPIDFTEINIAENKNASVLQPQICAKLLTKYFLDRQEAENKSAITYSQIMSFCKMLASQASNLAKTYLSVNHLSFIFGGVQNQLVKDFAAKIRSSFLEVLVHSALEFTMRSVFSSKSAHYQTIHELNKPENEIEINRQIQAAIANSIVSWEQSNHLTLLFDDAGKFTPVYRDFKQVSDNLRTIILSQNFELIKDEYSLAKVLAQKNLNEDGGKEILKDYTKLTHKDLLAILKDIGNMNLTKDQGMIASDDKLTDYVLTPDNFLKMTLIMNRTEANIPVVIMGETGCGKTSLVKYLATKVLKQEFDSFNLHAGITESTFLKRMMQYFDKANTLKSTLWLFLDEFNTCDSIGLISEMISNGTLLANPLPKNLRLIAACNPYKIKSVTIEVGLVQKKTSARLLHKVHPLPHSLMDFVWDYGYLNQNEEKKYIVNMIGMLRLAKKTSKMLTELISEVQEFIRKKEDSSSVSLRDVNRFKQVFTWFKSSLAARPPPASAPGRKMFSYWKKGVNLSDPKEITTRATILALTHCYIYRFSKKEHRKLLIQKCIEVMEINGWFFSEEKFKEICNDEQEDYLCRMNLPKGIALNSALKENVFTALVCIVNKIPCFICGKPGCSKTLTVQLLSTNLRGVDSIEPFFRTLPEIYVVTFQGSESSTSEGIEKAFEKARTLLTKSSKNRKILPLVVFDEMGLAELSPNNPLKVLHSLLEPDKAEIAFVGISNWRLDASKMNRVVFLARPDPDFEDLELTAISIHHSCTEQTNKQ